MPTTTVPIPGGEATLRDPQDVTARGRRAIQVLVSGLPASRARELQFAAGIPDQEAKEAALEAIQLNPAERETMLSLPDGYAYAMLAGWTLDRPLPASVDEVADLPTALYDAISSKATEIYVGWLSRQKDSDGEAVDPFSVGAIEDPESPTGVSAASRKRSTAAAARRAPSDRKKPTGGRSTATARSSPA